MNALLSALCSPFKITQQKFQDNRLQPKGGLWSVCYKFSLFSVWTLAYMVTCTYGCCLPESLEQWTDPRRSSVKRGTRFLHLTHDEQRLTGSDSRVWSSHAVGLQPNWSPSVTGDSVSITMSEPHLLAKSFSPWYRVLHYQARQWGFHTDSLSWTHLSQLRRDGLSSGRGAVSISYSWSIDRPSISLTCLQDCCGGKRLNPDCAEVSVSDQNSYILQTVFFFLLNFFSN